MFCVEIVVWCLLDRAVLYLTIIWVSPDSVHLSYCCNIVSRTASGLLVTFRVSRRPREMYCGHARLCVCPYVCLCVCLSAAACLHHCTDPDVTWRSASGCPLVVHCWADLQSVHGLRCYGNTINAWQSPAVIRQAHRTPHAVPRTTHAGEDSSRRR